MSTATPVDGEWTSPHAPDETQVKELLHDAPPMRGLEYLTKDSLTHWWSELDALTAEKSAACKGGLPAYLNSLNSDWNTVGRVTFHLAEKQEGCESTVRIHGDLHTCRAGASSARGAAGIRHVPLSEAVRQSVETGDKDQLDVLPEPVSRAARSTPWSRNCSKREPCFRRRLGTSPWRLSFFRRCPNWNNQASSSACPIGGTPASARKSMFASDASSPLSARGLDLQVGVSIDGEALTDKELEQLAEARQGRPFARKMGASRLGAVAVGTDQWKSREKSISGLAFWRA
ncbi:MAG: hypothetical protein R3C56_32410 [Pirellulaceae bacterium]